MQAMDTLGSKLETVRRQRTSDAVWASVDAAMFVLSEFRKRVAAGTLIISTGKDPHYEFDPAVYVQESKTSAFTNADWIVHQEFVLDAIREATGLRVHWDGAGSPIKLHSGPKASPPPTVSPPTVPAPRPPTVPAPCPPPPAVAAGSPTAAASAPEALKTSECPVLAVHEKIPGADKCPVIAVHTSPPGAPPKHQAPFPATDPVAVTVILQLAHDATLDIKAPFEMTAKVGAHSPTGGGSPTAGAERPDNVSACQKGPCSP